MEVSPTHFVLKLGPGTRDLGFPMEFPWIFSPKNMENMEIFGCLLMLLAGRNFLGYRYPMITGKLLQLNIMIHVIRHVSFFEAALHLLNISDMLIWHHTGATPERKKIWDRCVSRFMSQTIHHPPLSPFTHELRTGWDCGFQIFPLTTFAKLILASTHKWYNWSGTLRESNSKGHIGRPGKHPWKGPGQPTWKLLGSWNQLNPCAVHRPQEMMDDVVILIYLDGHWNCGPVDPVTDWRFQIFFRLGI